MNNEDFLEAYLSDRQKIVEEALQRYLSDEDGVPHDLHNAMHYSVFAGAKGSGRFFVWRRSKRAAAIWRRPCR